jgi:iron complex transport system ATP-binding protein
MVQQPSILMLDEPTANLDLFWREEIVAILHSLHKNSQMTIVLVCHELEVIPSCCLRLLVLQNGAIAADGPPDAILTNQLVESLYGTRLQLVASGGRYAAAPVGGPEHA